MFDCMNNDANPYQFILRLKIKKVVYEQEMTK